MSMGTPGWNPGADAMRAHQEAVRLNQESVRRMQEDARRIGQANAWSGRVDSRRTPSGRVGRFIGLLVALAIVATMVVVAAHVLGQQSNASPPDNGPCITVAGCTP